MGLNIVSTCSGFVDASVAIVIASIARLGSTFWDLGITDHRLVGTTHKYAMAYADAVPAHTGIREEQVFVGRPVAVIVDFVTTLRDRLSRPRVTEHVPIGSTTRETLCFAGAFAQRTAL